MPDDELPNDEQRGPGRPPKPESKRRTQSHGVFFSPDEMEEVKRKASEAGLPVSAYIRKAALEQDIELRSKADQQVRRELRAIGKNLNQLTRLGHLGEPVGEAAQNALGELRDVLKSLR